MARSLAGRPIQQPGHPSGKCLGAKAFEKIDGKQVLVCRCGKHNRSEASGRS